MFDHVEFSVTNITAARNIYGPICAAVGAQEMFFDESTKEVGFGSDDRVRLFISEGSATTPKLHLCFTARSRSDVEKAYARSIAGGGVCNGPPGYRKHYAAGYFAAFVHDPDGHNVEILFRDPSPQT